METIKIPSTVAMLAAKRVPIKAFEDVDYKKLKRPLESLSHSISVINKKLSKLDDEVSEALKDLRKGDEPVISDMYVNGDFIESLRTQLNFIEDALQDYGSILEDIEE